MLPLEVTYAMRLAGLARDGQGDSCAAEADLFTTEISLFMISLMLRKVVVDDVYRQLGLLMRTSTECEVMAR